MQHPRVNGGLCERNSKKPGGSDLLMQIPDVERMTPEKTPNFEPIFCSKILSEPTSDLAKVLTTGFQRVMRGESGMDSQPKGIGDLTLSQSQS